MNLKNEKIGIFDSGLGAMSVLKEIRNILPNENYIYYGDSANAPYGLGKTDRDIQILCENVVKFFIQNNCKAIIVASNTATIAAIDYLQEKFSNVHIIGIIDSAIEIAIKKAKESNKKIAVLSTKFTADSHTYRDFIQKCDGNIEVFEIGCVEFASMIEKGWETFNNADSLLQKYISMIPNDYSTLILGCTHYPLILDEIKKYYKGEIIDPAKELAIYLKDMLDKKNLLTDRQEKGKTTFFVSGEIDKFKPVAEKFLTEKIDVYKL